MRAASQDEILNTGESIHQERVFKASRKRVYEALTVSEQFDKVVDLSGAMQDPMMSEMRKPTQISPTAGGGFALFGGYIVGRQIELVGDRLIVQAWRVGGWNPGKYSIARFELVEEGPQTRLMFDHTAFPQHQAEHLAAGWQEHYWTPLEKYLS
ncbi:MAG: SRPBCC domain-containing protein [Burkholderiaceae bacterium]